jgi:sugar phosphate isomerase/epimerase
MKKRRLTASYWTLAGVMPSGDGVSRFPFRDRVEAAAKAGYTGMGLWHSDLASTLSRHTPAEMRSILSSNGITRIEVEFLVDWFAEGGDRHRSDARRRFLFGMAEKLGAKVLKVGDFSRSAVSVQRLTDSFAALCAHARDRGLTVALEPMDSCAVRTLADAKAVVTGAAAVNGGILIDLWHVAYLGIPYSELAQFPVKYVVGAEIDDAVLVKSTAHPQGRAETRTLCGRGDLDVAGFVRCLDDMGYTGPWGVEVIADELAAMDLNEAARLTYDTSFAALSKAN